MIAHIEKREPIGPPGLREPSVHINGIIGICACFAGSGKVTNAKVLSGPAMMYQAVLDSVRNWKFAPVLQGSMRRGACGTFRIRTVVDEKGITNTVEE